MKFNRVCIHIKHDIMLTSSMICYEHEVPIHQVIHGSGNVTEEIDSLGRTGPAGDFDLNDEWDRLMDKPRMAMVGENQSTPAPLVAFPRGVHDLEDFYARLKRPKADVVEIKQPATENELVKSRLTELGIDFRGNASTASLKELLASVENDSADLQNEG